MTMLAMPPATQSKAAPTTQRPAALPPSMIERMTLIVDLFGERETRMSLESVARSTGLPRSTAHRILDQLVRLEWLQHSGAGYQLGRRSLGLGDKADDSEALRAAAAPHLHNLLVRTGAVVHLGVLDGPWVRYLDKLGGRFAAQVPSQVGGTALAHCTALGKAMLAYLSPEEVDDLIGEQPSTRTPASIGSLPGLHQELTRVRARHGVAVERGEFVPQIACLAAAIRGPYGAIGAVSIVASAGTDLTKAGPLLVDTARRIGEARLGRHSAATGLLRNVG